MQTVQRERVFAYSPEPPWEENIFSCDAIHRKTRRGIWKSPGAGGCIEERNSRCGWHGWKGPWG